MFELISWIVFGIIVGALARLVLSGSDPMSLFVTMLLGVAGSIVGGFVSSLLFGGGFLPAGFFLSLLGAILLLIVVRRVRSSTVV